MRKRGFWILILIWIWGMVGKMEVSSWMFFFCFMCFCCIFCWFQRSKYRFLSFYWRGFGCVLWLLMWLRCCLLFLVLSMWWIVGRLRNVIMIVLLVYFFFVLFGFFRYQLISEWVEQDGWSLVIVIGCIYLWFLVILSSFFFQKLFGGLLKI